MTAPNAGLRRLAAWPWGRMLVWVVLVAVLASLGWSIRAIPHWASFLAFSGLNSKSKVSGGSSPPHACLALVTFTTKPSVPQTYGTPYLLPGSFLATCAITVGSSRCLLGILLQSSGS